MAFKRDKKEEEDGNIYTIIFCIVYPMFQAVVFNKKGLNIQDLGVINPVFILAYNYGRVQY